MKESQDYDKIDLRFEKHRLGKVESFNRAVHGLDSDITFLVSGDVRFEPSIFNQLEQYFADDVGMVIPRVVPSPPQTLAESAGNVIWLLHDIILENAYRKSKYFCGGEFQAVKHPMPLFSPEIVNDDEFLCHQVYASGRKVVYAKGVKVTNFMPTHFKQLLQQRVRINFGHLQSKKVNGWHSSISIDGFRDTKGSAGALFKFLQRYKKMSFALFVAFVIEMFSIFLAKVQILRGQSYRYWHLSEDEN